MAPTVIIVGAGIGGLTAALALLKSGFKVRVLEKAPELREVGAGVQISPNGTRVLYALGLESQIAEVRFLPAVREMRIWNTGAGCRLPVRQAEVLVRFGFPHFTIHRGDLHAILVTAVRAIDPNAISLNAECSGFAQAADGVEAILTDGSRISGNALVGADGIHSRIRAQLFGSSKARFTGGLAWRGVIPVDRLPMHMRERTLQSWVGPNAHFVVYPIRRGELINVVGHTERDDWRIESWIVTGTREEFAADFPGWHSEILTLIDNIDTPYKWALCLHDTLPAWSVGRVTLLGDACHPTLPYLAQGANMAIEDGFVLARTLHANGDVAAAFKAYQEIRIPRTTRIVNSSAENLGRFHNPALSDPQTASEYLDKAWQEQMDIRAWIYEHDATSVN